MVEITVDIKHSIYGDIPAAGIRVSDLLTLRKSNFDGEHIRFKSRKTRRWSSIKLPQKAINIIKKYSRYSKEEYSLIFPFLNGGINWEDKTAVFNAISSATAAYCIERPN